MDEMDKIIEYCTTTDKYLQRIEEISESIVVDDNEAEMQKLYRQCMQEKALREAERDIYLNLIRDKDIQIKIYSDSYQLIIQSKWWKLTKWFRYLQEVIQKHIFHKKTMSQTLVEIADLSRYTLETTIENVVESSDMEILSKPGIEKTYPVSVSIVIPTYNAGGEFKNLLAMLKGQAGIDTIEIIVVDSGSKDDTIEICQYFGVDLIQISQEEFSHSYARNLGASKAKGDYVLFMTQDAEPTDSIWLYRMVSVLEERDVVAVSPAETDNGRGDLKYLIDSWNHNRYLGIEKGDKIGYYQDTMSVEEIRKNAQLTDISCMVKRDIFEKYRYEGDFAEDLRLGLHLIKDGYRIAQLGSVQVRHTHHRSCGYWMKRTYVDCKTLISIFPEMKTKYCTEKEMKWKIVEGYRYVTALIRCIQGDWEEGNHVQEFCVNFSKLVDEFYELDDLIYKYEYSDDFTDSIIQEIAKGAISPVQNNKEFYFYLRNYVNGNIIPYLYAFNKVINKAVLVETLYKTYTAWVGLELANYVTNNEDDFTKKIKDEFVGV